MIRINSIASYICHVCMVQIVYRQFTDTLAAKVSINQNITGLVGNKDTHLTCFFIKEKSEEFLSVEIIAKNITENFEDEKRPIAIFEPERTAKLHPTGEYLLGRVTLTNITYTSTNATLNFHVLKGTDEKDYRCKYYYKDKFRAFSIAKSKDTRILVKVPAREVNINNQPNHKQYDRKTDNITLSCKAIGNPEPRYTWFKEKNNTTILSRTSLYVIEDVIRNNSGVYVCEAYNSINNVNYTQSNSVEIDIVDDLLLSQEQASSENSAGHAVYAVLVILVLPVFVVVIFLVRRNHGSYRSTTEKNKKSSIQNRLGCLKEWYCSDENLSYIPVVDKKEPGDVRNEIKKNEIICKNNEKDIEKNFDIIQNLPTTSSNIYAVPCDSLPEETVTCKIVKDRGKNEDNGVSDQDPVYSEVFNEKKMKYEMSMQRTSEPPDIVVHNGDGISADQCHV